MNNLEKWFDKQKNEGLVDLKISIVPGKGISNGAVVSELLAAEAAIHAGFFRDAPAPSTANDPAIDEILKSVRITGA